jgi:myosin protein heavy chain
MSAPNGRGFATSRNSHARPSPFTRNPTNSPSPGPANTARPKSGLISSPLAETEPKMAHARNQSLTQLSSPLGRSDSSRLRSNSARNSTPMGTFAPQFIGEEGQETPRLGGIVEGENDFSGKRYVWLKDPTTAFVRGWVVEDLPEGRLLVQCDNGTQQEVDTEAVDKVNPAKFDKADDMAELTHLNEPSVIHNLHMRYQADLIYVRPAVFDIR